MMNSFSFWMSENIFSYFLKGIFAESRILGWQFFSLGTLKILLLSLPACVVSDKKSAVLHTCVLSCVTCLFSRVSFKVFWWWFFIFGLFFILDMMYLNVVFFMFFRPVHLYFLSHLERFQHSMSSTPSFRDFNWSYSVMIIQLSLQLNIFNWISDYIFSTIHWWTTLFFLSLLFLCVSL